MESIWTICLILGGAILYIGKSHRENYLLQASVSALGAMVMLAGVMGSVMQPKSLLLTACVFGCLVVALILVLLEKVVRSATLRRYKN